ncbi:MAG: hypothetical protein JXA41_00665 [Deltaproteobacteria bacterium]|nr:hypothetical protein [Deltaproteobacteria bacterium]
MIRVTPLRRIDILGMDACLTAMIEVTWQLNGCPFFKTNVVHAMFLGF